MAKHATDVIFISSSDFVSNPVNGNTKETSEVNTTEPKVEDAEDTDQEPTCHHNSALERERVIALFAVELDFDWRSNGPMRREIERLAKKVREGHQIALGCWCKPCACHLDLVLAKIRELL